MSYELLRKEPTQSGVAYPKYYAWVRVHRDDGLLEGAVRLAAVDDEKFEVTNFEVTHFLGAREIVTSPRLIEPVFPQPLHQTIRDRARTAAGARPEVPAPMSVGGDVKPPRMLNHPSTDYNECRAKGRPLRMAILEVVIGVDGRARDVRMLKPVDQCVERTVLEVVQQMRFQPGTYRGKPVAVRYNLTISPHYR